MINIALIGCGKISIQHINAFREIDDAKITAVCDISEKNLADACAATGAVGYCDYKEMLEKERIDLAIINLPHFLHKKATCFCAEHGINIFLEKPMSVSAKDCDDMIGACEKNNVMLWVGHPAHFNASNRFAKGLIDSGKLGELISFSETRNQFYFSDDRPRWFLTKKMSGGGIMMNLGVHSLDKLKYFSDSEIADIKGNVHIHEGFDVEDCASVLVKMKNGVVGMINLNGQTCAWKNDITLYLTKGEIRINPDASVEYCGVDGVFKKQLCKGNWMAEQLRSVVSYLNGEEIEIAVSGEYGLDIVRAIERLYSF